MGIIEFTKMYGAGNDYTHVDATCYPVENPGKLSKEWSVLHTGVGNDGLVLIGCPDKADFSMCIFNVDGLEAKMCGNADRYIGRYLCDYKLISKTEITLDTLSGIKTLKPHAEDNKADTATVDIGAPACEPTCYDGKEGKPVKEYPIEIDGARYTGTTVSMDSPYLVILVDGITKVDFPIIDSKPEDHLFSPGRISVEPARVLEEGRIRTRVWKRSSGITQACGIGACVIAVTALLTGRLGRKVTVIMDRGALTIEWGVATGYVFMTGSTIRVFNEEIETNDE